MYSGPLVSSTIHIPDKDARRKLNINRDSLFRLSFRSFPPYMIGWAQTGRPTVKVRGEQKRRLPEDGHDVSSHAGLEKGTEDKYKNTVGGPR